MDVSVVIPVYNEERNVRALHSALKKELDKLRLKYEIIFIDDGSTDNTCGNIINIKDKKIKIVQFQSNYGKAAALMAGFKKAKGDIIITMDGDLQDEPGEIKSFIGKLDHYDLVSGWKFKRKDPITKVIASRFFNLLTRLATGIKIHDFNCGFKAYKKKVIKNINVYGELHRYIPALAYWKGFKVGEIKVRHHARRFGKSKYGFTRLFKGFIDLITVKFLITYGKRPSHLFGFCGSLLSLIGIATIAVMYLRKFLFGIAIGTKPYLFMLAVLSIILGFQFISLGLLGEMIADRTERKEYIIKKEF